MKKKRLGEILVAEQVITEEQLQEALKLQKELGLKLGEVLEQQGWVTEEKVINSLQKQLGIRLVNMDHIQINQEALNSLPEEMAKKYEVIPLDIENGQLILAMKDPLNYFAIEDIRMGIGLRIKPVIAYREELDNAIKKYYGKSVAEKALGQYVKQNKTVQKNKKEEKVDEENAPIMKFINTTIENAIRNKASDIHIEPEENELRIRFRIDGVLNENLTTSSDIVEPVVSRIKIMSGLDITEKRKPQDGRSFYTFEGKKVDLRISILPVSNGEKVVIRILDKSNFVVNKNFLGMTENEIKKYTHMIKKPHGIVLITGPTGSGKTTTLYSMLNELNDPYKNIVTVEDPIEFNFTGINQVQVNNGVGLNFAEGLRSILRQDPDVIMVGEIRDNETAEIAIRSALTGHLVLSTLHTNDSIGTISRLLDMGIEPFLIASTLNGIIAQRLVRKNCEHCKAPYKASDTEKKILGVKLDRNITIYKSKGCNACNHSGYKGRTAVFEMLYLDSDYKKAIEEEKSYSYLQSMAKQKKMSSLRVSTSRKVLSGETSIEELMRVTYL